MRCVLDWGHQNGMVRPCSCPASDKLARDAKDKEHAMSQIRNTAIADIGKNSFQVVATMHAAPSCCGKSGRVAKWKCGSPIYRLADRHGSLRRRTSPEPQTRIAWSRCQVDAGQICSSL